MASIQTLLTQFQTRYPLGSVTSELLTIYEGSFVVRAVIQVGSTTLATAMAAATDIEQAEDRAKVRALSALGIGSSFAGNIAPSGLAYPLPPSTSFEPAQTLTAPEAPVPSPIAPQPTFADRPASDPLTVPTPPPQPVRTSEPWFPEESRAAQDMGSSTNELFQPTAPPESGRLPEAAPDLDSPSPSIVELDFSPEPAPEQDPAQPERLPEPEPAKPTKSSSKSKSTRRKEPAEETAAETPPPQEIVDRSDVNAKIGVEMKRLSWTVEQGRNHLKRTYGKRSRQELEDSELLDFLNYLEAQPMPANSPF
ncbi:hypothetical protein [Egbenema bharatensis]|uniref:hypothetical protein n=1 Tax=Egbenema bharatensis TaxID=3463334 RepID=UPI003A84C717